MNFIKYAFQNVRSVSKIGVCNCLLNHRISCTPAAFQLGNNAFCHPFSISTISRKKNVEQRTNITLNDEKLFLVKQNNPDVFGNQSGIVSSEAFDDDVDPGDLAEEEYLGSPPNRSNRLRTKQYADIIKEHLRNKRIKEAIDVLEVRMIREDRVKPENYIYNLLIGGCARHGYTNKAFSLFNRMKQRDLKVTGGTYTSLFNACSTSPWISDGLKKANRLRDIMLEKGYEPNASNYNAMIKSYGRCGDLKTAFQLVDEMRSKKIAISVETFNFLLQACASDREFGFRHSLLVWHKIYQRRLVPDIYSFNLMLRCVRDCNIGDIDTMENVIQTILGDSTTTFPKENLKLAINAEQNNSTSVITIGRDDNSVFIEADRAIKFIKDDAPNLLAVRPHLGKLVGIGEIKKAEDRLLLLGGISGFLREMQLAKVVPTIKTFTQLIEVIPPTLSAEKKIIATIQRLGVKCDIDFFNVLIKKRSMRFDYVSAKEVIEMIEIADLKPDIVTYGVLALGCQTPEDADHFLQEMYNKGVRMNIQILGAMLRQGTSNNNFQYISKIMQISQSERIKPNDFFLKHLQQFHARSEQFNDSKKPYSKTKKFQKDFQTFCKELKDWEEFMGLQNTESYDEAIKIVREHPWEQFKYDQPDGMEDIKNPKLRHKKKLNRFIKRIKTDSLRNDEDFPRNQTEFTVNPAKQIA